ncbi:hypothetical protein CY35_03G128700 [Sphagnum magellanicum]|nr:hypothetical protein CY35_03G128700 [Sphagnum magellanicum]
MKAAAKSMDSILDTVACAHCLDPYLRLLKTNGKLVTVGIPEKPLSFHSSALLWASFDWWKYNRRNPGDTGDA